MMRGGYNGEILWLDLGNGDVQAHALDDTIAQRFVVGRGYDAKMLYDKNPAEVRLI